MTQLTSAELVWIGSIFHRTGYSAATRNHLRGLHRLGFPVHVQELWRNSNFLPSDEDMLWYSEMSRRKPAPGAACVIMHPPTLLPDGLSILEHCRYSNPGMGRYIAYTMFESDRLPANWVERLDAADEIWVPTQFNRDTFAKSGVDERKLRVVPLSIDTDFFDARRHFPKRNPQESEFKFLSAFEWTPRKGWDGLVRAFAEEFGPGEKVSLTLRTRRGLGSTRPVSQSIREELEAFCRKDLGKSLQDLPPIFIDESRLSDEELPAYYLGHNAFVSTSHGEGWGMPMMEAMSLGLPTAAPRWGGQLEFMNEQNSYLIGIDGLVSASPEMVIENPIYAGHRWAQPSVADTRRVLREMFERPQEAMQKARLARERLVAEFSLSAIASKVKRCVQDALPSQASPTWMPAEVSMEGKQPETFPVRVALRLGASCSFGHQRVDYELKRAFSSCEGVSVVNENENPQVLLTHDDPASIEPPPEGCRWIWFARIPDGAEVPEPALATLRDRVDEIWVTSAKQREAYFRAGIPESKIRIVSLGVDSDLFHPDAKPLQLADRSSFRILSVLSLDGRQSFEALLGAFTESFQAPDDVCLVLKIASTNSAGNRSQAERELLERLRDCPAFGKTLILEEDLSETEMAGLYASCHAFMAPYASSFHRTGVLEAMACGLPVIAPHERIAEDPVQEGRAFPFPIRAENAQPYERTLGELLKRVWKDPEGRARCAAQARRFVVEHRSWRAVASWMTSRMRELVSLPGGQESRKALAWPVVSLASSFGSEADGPIGAIRRMSWRRPEAALLLETGSWEASFNVRAELAQMLEKNPGAVAAAFKQRGGVVSLWRPGLGHLSLPAKERFRSGAYLLDLIREISSQGCAIVLDMRSGIRFRPAPEFFSEAEAVEALVLGQELRAGGENEEALLAVERALRAKPDYAAAAAEGVELLLELGCAEGAVALARKLVGMAPGWSRSRHLLGLALVGSGSESEGGAWVYQANRMDPANPLISADLGHLYERAGSPDQAFACYRSAWSNGGMGSEHLVRCLELLAQHPELPGIEEFVAELGRFQEGAAASA